MTLGEAKLRRATDPRGFALKKSVRSAVPGAILAFEKTPVSWVQKFKNAGVQAVVIDPRGL